MIRRHLLAALLAPVVLGLAACATPQAPGSALAAVPAASGRLSLTVDDVQGGPPQNLITGFRLTGSASAGTLTLDGALGTTALFIRWAPGSARLVRGDGVRDYASLDDLTREALGESLPLAALFDWLQGRPSPLGPWQAEAGQASPPRVFSQLGWRVDASQFAAQRLLQASRAAGNSPGGATPGVQMRIKLDAAP
ncbi:lipoprotein insertase outer membrane protein LolB [Amphibiibacter pelophylacis]|uniref:Lipoprotein insertase outer membrane protein LolB n=1 Tax=Amphibiibacter pelophylacis TaxID=1799477 RepID=A0ACC6P1R4_9BURK